MARTSIRARFGFAKDEPIPQNFYIRKSVTGSVKHPVLLYTYWSYRDTIHGVVELPMPKKIKGDRINERVKVLAIIRKRHPEAEFFRSH